MPKTAVRQSRVTGACSRESTSCAHSKIRRLRPSFWRPDGPLFGSGIKPLFLCGVGRQSRCPPRLILRVRLSLCPTSTPVQPYVLTRGTKIKEPGLATLPEWHARLVGSRCGSPHCAGRKPNGGRRRSIAKNRVVLKKAGEPRRPPNLAGGKGTCIGRLAI